MWYKISPAHIYCIWHETSQNVVVSFYYRLSIYRGYIWYDSAHSTTITTMKLRSDLHSRTTPILRPHGRAIGCHSWVIWWRKMTAIYREHSILSQIGRYVCLGSCHATVYTTVLYWATSVTARVHNTTFPREFCYFASALSVFCHFPGKSIVFWPLVWPEWHNDSNAPGDSFRHCLLVCLNPELWFALGHLCWRQLSN